MKFDNEIIDKIAKDCGLHIEPLNMKVTRLEIEFFAEKIIKYTIEELDSYQMEDCNDSYDRAIRSAVKSLKEHFKLS